MGETQATDGNGEGMINAIYNFLTGFAIVTVALCVVVGLPFMIAEIFTLDGFATFFIWVFLILLISICYSIGEEFNDHR